jgi:O-antigen/teichoic acid export membrane protein
MPVSSGSVRSRVAASSLSFIVGGIATLVTQIVAVRWLGVELYGEYATSIAVVALCELTVLNRGGEIALSSLGSVWTAQRWGDISLLLSRLLRMDIAWVVGGYGALALAALVVGDRFAWRSDWILLAGLAIPLQAGYGSNKAFLIVSGQITLLARAEIVVSLLTAALAITLALEMGALGLVIAYAGAALAKVLIIKHLADARKQLLPSLDRDGVSASVIELPSQLSASARNVVMAVGDQIDVVLVGALAGPAAAGSYRVAKSLASLPARAVGPLWAGLRPELLSHWFAPRRAGIRNVISRPTLLLMAGGVVVVPAAWLLGDDVISLIYGIDGRSVTPAMTMLLAGSWIYFGLAGWYRFLMLLDTNKWRSLVWMAMQTTWIVVAGYLAASNGPASMAVVVAVSQIALSIAATVWLLRSTRPG